MWEYSPKTVKIGENLYKKLRFFAIFEAVRPHFKARTMKIWHKGADLGLPPPSQILFLKIA